MTNDEWLGESLVVVFTILFLRPLDFLQRLLRRTRKHFSRRLKSRTVARAIPRLVGRVPAHDAFQVGANGREQANLAILAAIPGHFFAVQLQDFSLANVEFVRRFTLGAFKAVAEHVKRIVEILLKVAPGAAVEFFAIHSEELEPGILATQIAIARHRRREGAERKTIPAKTCGD